MELQQSPLYRKYIQSLGWQVTSLGQCAVFVKKIPFLGTLAKLQRISSLPPLPSLLAVIKKYTIKTLAIEPSERVSQQIFTPWIKSLSGYVKINTTPYLATKTIRADLAPPVDTIFGHFSEAKRRAVRRAEKNGVLIRESHAIYDLIAVKNTSAGFLGFITTHGTRELWDTFSPDHASILLAYKTVPASASHNPIGGILLIFHKQTAYYWIAGATHEGKKLSAPTLLVFEAMKLSKTKRMKWFDFIGVWDERIPKENTQWKGFTKFKEGFGGKELYYPVSKL
ncbi:peptidoglycan bridge formation glycyltransferase FemA/FemB family protein [Candidatus Gottesmanbacteria bacterium]|nr:peptidoglycan bridge formation glycyltransferase FemA/FemB family protein [Candidatus Gottesmanbacteria bacterium]